MADELRPENTYFRLFERFNRESLLVVLVVIAAAASIISWVRAEIANNKATTAIATAQTWQVMYKETERECRLAQLEVDEFKMALTRAGLYTEDMKP